MGSDCFLKSGDSTWVVNTEVCTLKSVQVRQVHVYVHVYARHGSIWAINLSEKDGNITNLGNIHYYEEIKQGNNGNIGNNGDN